MRRPGVTHASATVSFALVIVTGSVARPSPTAGFAYHPFGGHGAPASRTSATRVI